MALYRQGEASMTAEGQVTGYDTKWREPLSLIRKGATMVFLTTPLKLAVINTIDSDTEMTAITTDGEAVAQSKYVILLNDSLTVDGMAQDVAETLRYYQSKETMIEEAIEFFKDFDLQQIINLRNETQAFRNDAETFKGQAESSKNQAWTYANESLFYRNEAEGFKNQTQQIKDNALSEVGTAQTNAVNTVNQTRDQAVADVNNAKSDIGGMVTQAESARNAAQTAQSGSETARDQSQAFRNQAEQFANSINPEALLRKDGNLSGLTDVNAARGNLDLATNHAPVFAGIDLQGLNGLSSGVAVLRNGNPDGSQVSYSRIYNEIQSGVAKTTIQTTRDGGRTNYFQIDENGNVAYVNTISLSGKSISTSPTLDTAHRISYARTGATGSFVAGEVVGGAFDTWRDRAAGIIVEMVDVNQAVNVFKVVRWGQTFQGGMDCAIYGDLSCETKLNVGSGTFSFTQSGQAAAVQWINTSDIRLKARLKEIVSGKEKVKSLQGYTYFKRNNLEEDEHSIYTEEAGLIAQDVQSVLPEAVYNVSKTEYLGINYAGVTALLVEAIKEVIDDADKQTEIIQAQQDEIKELKNEIAEMKSAIAEMQAMFVQLAK